MVSTSPRDPALSSLLGRRAVVFVWIPLLAVGVLHYATPPDPHWVHDLARRLYYLPIVFAGSFGGVRAGLLTALLVGIMYAPHAFLGHVFHDPGTASEKLLEMVFYFVLGAGSGALSERAAAERGRLQRTLDDLQARDAQLQRAARLESMGELTAGLAHEIRNPLHAMRGTAEILLDAVPEDAPEREMGARHLAEIDRLAGLLTRFLAFAKGEEREHLPVDLADVVREVAALIGAQARGQDTVLSIEATEAPAALADRDQLVQVVLGIGINALQALGQGGRVRIAVASEPDPGERVGLTVFNDGPAIPPELLARIFDPFVSSREQGTGLGLSTAWRIVEAHNGALEANNTEDGVRFAIWLPRA